MVGRDNKHERLLERAKELNALQFGDFTLTSGTKSNYYFDGRVLSLDPEGLSLISSLFMERIEKARCDGIGGPAIAAVPIVGALVLQAHQTGKSLTGYYVREKTKAHGLGRQIEGSIKSGMKLAVFDDTLSTGLSLISAIEVLENFGCTVELVLCVLDRKQGGTEKILKRGKKIYSILEATQDGQITLSSR